MDVNHFMEKYLMNSFSYRSKDPHEPDFPTIITLKNNHNNKIKSESPESELLLPSTSRNRFLTFVFCFHNFLIHT